MRNVLQLIYCLNTDEVSKIMYMSNPDTQHFSSHAFSSMSNRDGLDRRSSYMRSLVYSCFKRRRTMQRRGEDRVENTFVDTHEPKLAFIFLLTLLLCIADAFLTLNIIDNGGEEVNPFMLFLMTKDLMLFFWVKFAMTVFGMLFLITHKHFTFYRVINGYHIFYGIAAMYVVLVNYEIFLITQVIPGS